MRKLKGVCQYCMGCNQLENINFEGVYKCKGFIPNQVNWEELLRNEMRKK